MSKVNKQERDAYLQEHPILLFFAIAFGLGMVTAVFMVPVVVVILILKAVL